MIPEVLMTRHRIDEFMTDKGAENVHIVLKDGRDVNVYALRRTIPDAPLEILDIPTTLLTSEKVIQRVDNFWGGGDKDFKESSLDEKSRRSIVGSVPSSPTSNSVSAAFAY